MKDITEYLKEAFANSPYFHREELSEAYNKFSKEFDVFIDYLGGILFDEDSEKEAEEQLYTLAKNIIKYGIEEHQDGIAKGIIIGTEVERARIIDIINEYSEDDTDGADELIQSLDGQ